MGTKEVKFDIMYAVELKYVFYSLLSLYVYEATEATMYNFLDSKGSCIHFIQIQ